MFLKKLTRGDMAFVEKLSGVNSQGETLEEAKVYLMEALELMIYTRSMLSEETLHNKKGNERTIAFCFVKATNLINFLKQQNGALIREGANHSIISKSEQ